MTPSTILFFQIRGFYFDGDFHLYLFANGLNKNFSQFSIAKAKAAYAKSLSKKVTVVVSTEGGFKIGGKETRSFDFFVGGFGFEAINNIIPFYGTEALTLRGDTYLKSVVTLDYELAKKHHLNVSANISNVGDGLFESGDWINRIDYSAYAIGYGLETFLGPLQLKYAYSPELDEGEWHVSAGFSF